MISTFHSLINIFLQAHQQIIHHHWNSFLFADFNVRSTTENRIDIVDCWRINKAKNFCSFQINFMKTVFFFSAFFFMFFAALAWLLPPEKRQVCMSVSAVVVRLIIIQSFAKFHLQLHDAFRYCARSLLRRLRKGFRRDRATRVVEFMNADEERRSEIALLRAINNRKMLLAQPDFLSGQTFCDGLLINTSRENGEIASPVLCVFTPIMKSRASYRFIRRFSSCPPGRRRFCLRNVPGRWDCLWSSPTSPWDETYGRVAICRLLHGEFI